MPIAQLPPPPVSFPRDDKSPSIPARSPSLRPILPHQPSPEPSSPPSKPESTTTTAITQQQPTESPTPPPSESPQKVVQPAPKKEQEQEPAKEAPPVKAEEAEDNDDDDDDDEPIDERDPIDMDTFQQILELDEEDDREFSKEMVWAYFSQAEKTFGDLDEALSEKDLTKLSHLGHFLKGSSAAMGVSRVETACEKIQHYGLLRDEQNDVGLSEKQALDLIKKTLVRVKKDYAVADKWLRRFYEEEN